MSITIPRMSRDPDAIAMNPFYFFSRFFCQITVGPYFRARIFNANKIPNTGPVILLSNHQSFLDPILAAFAIRREAHFMARDTLFSNPLFAWLIGSVNAFPVRRATADISALKQMLRRLKAGKVVVVFPEGTRTTTGRIQRFHPGFAAVAKRARAAIVPVAIEGAFDAWPRWRKIPASRRICVQYGDPIGPDDVAAMTNDDLLAESRTRMIAAHNIVRRRMGQSTYED